MDFTLGSMEVYSNNAGGSSEISLASMASEMAESRHQQQRMLSDSAGDGLISSSSLKQHRSATDDLGGSSDHPWDDHCIAPLKLARTHSFSSRSQHDVKLMQAGCSPAIARVSEDALLNSDSSLVSDSRQQLLLRGGGEHAAYILAGQSAPSRYVPSLQHDSYFQHHRPTPGLPLVMGRGGLLHSGVHEAAIDGRHLFTPSQWAELEHQALIYKYLMHGAPVPPELLLPLRRSLATSISSFPLSSHGLGNGGWGSFQLGVSGNVDPEPGRCRRTDGKKWRCARPVVAEQKYCERHMHRGRHRKKAAEAHNSAGAAAPSPSPSPSPSTNAAHPPSSKRDDISRNFPISHSLRPPVSSHHPHATTTNLSVQTLAASGAMTIGTTSAGSLTCNRFPVLLHSPSSLPSSKDHNRFLKAQFGLRNEQFASDFSANMHGLVDHLHHFSTTMPSTQQLSWHVQPPKIPPSADFKSNNSWLLQNSDHELKCFQGHQEMAMMADASRLNTLLSHHQQQQNRPSLFPTEALEDDSKSQGQPLRHFFDDWPRTRGSSALSWPDAEEEKLKVDALSPQLSISIPVNSSEISVSDRPARGKAVFTPISLSTLKNADDIADPTHMGLGMGMGLGISSSHRQPSWFPRAMEDAVGGPLAEALQSGAPHSGENTSENFFKEEWDVNPHDAPQIASPTGVLQKVPLGTCFSDSSSNASSPGSVRTEHANAENQRLTPVLTNCSSRLST